jgi:TetR/AcrR family transcriptional regulator
MATRPQSTGPPPGDLRREQIAVAARDVFAARGLAGARTREIAKAANVTETVLYRHFSSKEEIFEAAVLEPVERLASDLLRLTAGFARADAGKRLELSEHVHEEIQDVVDQITPLLGIALFSGGERGREFYRERLAPVLRVTVDAIRQAMSPRQQQVMEPRTLLLTIVGMYFGLSLDALFSGSRADSPAAAHQLTHLVAFGLPAADTDGAPEGKVSGTRRAATPRPKARASKGR